MSHLKRKTRRSISILCILAMLIQVFSGYSELFVFASDTEKTEFQTAIEEAEYMSTYAGAETAELALTTATTKVQEVISARTDESESAASLVINAGELTLNAKGGTYTFTATVTPSDGTAFTTDEITMTVSACPDAIKIVYDDEETVSNADIGALSSKTFVDETADGGKSYMHLVKNSTSTEMVQSSVATFDFAEYPYIKISFRNERTVDTNWDYMQIFGFKDGMDGYLCYSFYPYQLKVSGQDTSWKELVLDMNKGRATYYKGTGLYAAEGGYDTMATYHSVADTTWTGNGTVRIDWTNAAAQQNIDIEYIAFFGSKEEAEAYPTELGNLQQALENADYTAKYAQADSVAEVTTVAEAQVQSVIETWAEYTGATATYELGETANLTRYVSGGTFEFDIVVTPEDGSTFKTTLTMTIEARPDAVAIVFDSESKVTNAGIGNATKTFVDDSADSGKVYMKLVTTTSDQMYNFGFSDLCESGTLDLDAYPYIKISYRNMSETVAWDFLYMWVTTDAYSSAARYQILPYDTATAANNGIWNEAILDMKSNTVSYNVTPNNGTYFDNVANSWTGNCSNIRMDFTARNGIEVDIEYIAFFATEAQANAYPGLPDDTVDTSLEILANATFSCESEAASTEEDALNELSSQLEALEMPAAYTLQNGVYVAPTTTSAGSYKADVVFAATGDMVTVKMVIEKVPIVPVVWTFDNNSILSQFTGTNATMTYDNGYVKMITANTGRDDGFFLQGNPLDSEKFDIANLPYLKLKYKITGAESAPMQIFYWVDSGRYYYRTVSANDPDWDGDTVTVIADLSVLGTGEDAVWLENLTDNVTKTLSYDNAGADAGDTLCEGTVTQVRFNLARQANLDRTAEVEYIGFFPSYEAAAAYEGAAEERVTQAVKYLEDNTIEMRWASGSTQEKAEEGAKIAIEEAGVGCTEVKDIVYVAPSEESEGSITCTAVLKSAEVTAEATLTVVIGKKPSEPIVWRFNDSEFLSKLSFASMKATIEGDYAKLESTNPTAEDGFYFIVNLPEDTDQFYLEDYSYIRLRYKRQGLAPGQLYFYSDALLGNPNQGSLGYGTQEDVWYTSIIDTSVNNFTDTKIYNINESTGETEHFVKYAAYGTSPYTWEGLSTAFRFNFGRRANLDRTMYLEYIAFFPTLEDAQAYDAENERLKANAELALRSYSGSDVSYYEGYTADAAKDKAYDIISEMVGDNVEVVINQTSYTEPVKDTTDGSYEFYVEICNGDGEVLYTTSEYTLTISSAADTDLVIFTFTNPDFIARVDGTAPTAMDYACMNLSDDLTTQWKLSLKGTEKFHLEGHPYIACKIDTTSGDMQFTLNEQSFSLEDASGDGVLLVIDTATSAIYQNGEKLDTTLDALIAEQIKTIGMTFADTATNVYYMAFFASLDEALAYDGESETLTSTKAAVEALSLDCAYADATTEDEALTYAVEKISANLDDGVSLVSAVCTSYIAASGEQTGSISVQAVICVGTEQDSHYAVVNMTIAIGKKPTEPIVWNFTEEFISRISRASNVTLTATDYDTLQMDTVTHTATDGFYFTVDSSKVDLDFYLQDYPYIKMKYRYHSYGSSTGTSMLYFANDETGNAYRTYSIGSVAYNDTWCSAILDMNENTITLSDLKNSELLSVSSMGGNSLAYRGKPNWFRVNMGHWVTCQRHAEIEYIAFFSSEEEAVAYESDYAYDAYDFNGIEYAKTDATLASVPKTIEAAIHTAGNGNDMTVISTDDYALETMSDGNVRFVYGGETVLQSTDVNVCDLTWHQLAVTFEDGSAILYVDGAQVATNADFTRKDNETTAYPVVAQASGDSTSFKGRIYYVRLYDTVQTADDLSANAYNKACTEHVIAGWFTDSLSNGEFDDVCDKCPLTLMDNYDYEGHEFLGNDYIKTEQALSAEPKTFEFWMKAPESAQTGTYTILSNKTDGSTDYTAIELVEGLLQMTYNGTTLFTTEQSFADNIWKHVAVTLGDSVQLYVDGVLTGTYTTAYTTGNAASRTYYIGAGLESTKTPFVGKLSDVRIWSTERSQAEIAENMQDYLAEVSTELLSSWKLDMQTYLKYTDDSSNGNTGTLYSSGWYKLENITGDYSMGAIGDTQSYMLTTPSLFLKTFEKLAEKVDDFNMKYMFHLGDVTQNDTLMEWRYARQAFDYIEGILPYSIILGNHDYPSPSSGTGAEFRSGVNFNSIFPMSTFENQSASDTEDTGTREVGAFEENDVSNIYTFFNVGDTEYIIFSLEYGPRDEVLEWAGKVLDRYPEKTAIILTHGYFGYGGSDGNWGKLNPYQSIIDAGGSDFDTANDGQAIWDELLSKHANIALLLCGHSQNPFIVYRETEGDYGNTVVQMMVDHSAMVTGFPSKEGLMTILSFDEETGAMHTYWYSPLYDAYYSTGNEVTFDMSDNLVDTDREEYYEPYDDISEFRSEEGYTYPVSEKYGYIFAGWYDAETKEPLDQSAKSGDALAKFVDADILSVKMQASVEEQDDGTITVPDDETQLRFVTSVDSLSYSKIGFLLAKETEDGSFATAKSTASGYDAKTVYDTLYYVGASSGQVMGYSAGVFSKYANFLKTYTMYGIPASDYGINIQVTPYWETLDGTTVCGRTRTVCVNDIIEGISEY